MARYRFNIQPGDVPAHAAARRLGISEADFKRLLPSLIARGFPAPDETTGNFDIEAIDQWRKRRNPALFLDDNLKVRQSRAVIEDRFARLAADGKA